MRLLEEYKGYEIRGGRSGEAEWVQGFRDGQPATMRYGVTPEVAADMSSEVGEAAIGHLIAALKREIDNRERRS
jgi:hypothetical protein